MQAYTPGFCKTKHHSYEQNILDENSALSLPLPSLFCRPFE
jgi:hypothetical protein